MNQLDPKFVASARPINRRTAARELRQAEPVNPVVQERLAALKMRNRFGAPLAEQLRMASASPRPYPLSAWLVLGGVTFAVSAVGLFLAWIQSSWLLAVAGLAGVSLALAGIVVGRRMTVAHCESYVLPALFDDAAVNAFDMALDKLAPEVPEEIAIELTGLKQQLKRIAQLGTRSFIDEVFTMEDRMYLTESVRRYLPDTLQSYLVVPQDQRATQLLEQGQTADLLLLGQLKLLRVELTKLEMKLTKSSAEGLMKQQRFLESKVKR